MAFLAQQLRHILMRALLVAAEIEELIAVTHDGFPLLFKQGFELGKVLNDNAHGNFPRTHSGKQLVELIRERNIGELVHDKVDMDGSLPP